MRLSSLLLLLSLLAVPMTARAADAVTRSADDHATMAGTSGSLTRGESGTWFGDRQRFRVWSSGPEDLMIGVSSGDDANPLMDVTVRLPAGGSLEPGVYETEPHGAPDQPRLALSVGHDGCSSTFGRVTVLQLDPDPTRRSYVSLHYQLRCDPYGEDWVFGELRYGLPREPAALQIVPGAVAWPGQYPGLPLPSVPVTLVNRSLGPVTVTEAAVDTGAADFTVTANSCSLLLPGARCKVEVGHTPSAAGVRSGALSLATDSGAATVPLAGAGHPGSTYWRLSSWPGDPLGDGGSWQLSPQDTPLFYGGGTAFSWSGGAGGGFLHGAFATDTPMSLGTTYTSTGEPGTGVGRLHLELEGRSCPTNVSRFAVHDLAVDTHGAVTAFAASFVQLCEGSRVPLRGSVGWRAAAQVPPPAFLRVGTDRGLYVFGATARVVLRVSEEAVGRAVHVYAHPRGRSRRLLATVVPDSMDTVPVTTRVSRRTLFSAELADGEHVALARGVRVRARISAAPRGYYEMRRVTHLYRAGGVARVRTVVRPHHEGDCVRMEVQRRVDRAWHHLRRTACLELAARSAATYRIPGRPALTGDLLRVRAAWPGDIVNAPSRTRWQLLRFTR